MLAGFVPVHDASDDLAVRTHHPSGLPEGAAKLLRGTAVSAMSSLQRDLAAQWYPPLSLFLGSRLRSKVTLNPKP